MIIIGGKVDSVQKWGKGTDSSRKSPVRRGKRDHYLGKWKFGECIY